MSQPVLHDDFRDLLRALQDAEVRFLVVGAHALSVHGVPRATGDLDIFVASDRDNAARLVRALRAFGAPLEVHGIRTEDFEHPETVYQIGLPPRRIDIMTSISGVSFEDADRGSIVTEIEGMSLPVLGRNELLKNKVATGRAKDLVDAEMLRKSRA